MAILVYEETYRAWKIKVYELPTGTNRIQFSCYNPKGENVDHLKNSDFPVRMSDKEYAVENARLFIDRLIRENEKNYQLWQTLPGEEDAPSLYYQGTIEEARRIFEAGMPGWRTQVGKWRVTENGQSLPTF